MQKRANKRYSELHAMMPKEDAPLLQDIIEEVVYLESQLDELRVLPKITVNPANSLQQRLTPAAKLYKEYLQQYINAIKAMEYVLYRDRKLTKEEAEESPLRAWYKKHE